MCLDRHTKMCPSYKDVPVIQRCFWAIHTQMFLCDAYKDVLCHSYEDAFVLFKQGRFSVIHAKMLYANNTKVFVCLHREIFCSLHTKIILCSSYKKNFCPSYTDIFFKQVKQLREKLITYDFVLKRPFEFTSNLETEFYECR